MLKALAETKRKEQAENTERTAAPQVSDESVRGPLVSDLNRLTLPALEAERAERAAENRRNALSRPGRDAGVRNAWGERQQTGKAYVGALSRTGGGGNMTENARALSTARRGDDAAEDYRAQTMKAGAKAAVNQRGQMSLAELERYLSSGQFLADTVDYGDAVVTKGMSTASAGLARTADLFLGNAIEGAGKLIGRDWSDNFIRRYAADADAYNRYWTQELQRQAGDSRAKQIGGDLLSAAVAAAPMAIAAYLTGGASLAATGSLQATAAAQGTTVLQGVGQAVSTMLKNPNYWMSFIQEVGNDYYEAREWAPNDDIAAIYGLTVGLVNAGIETGLDGASGIQGLEKSIRQGNTGGLKSFLESIGGEAWEEDMQGLVSRGVGQMFGSGAKTFSMTDENAVINPATMLEEGAMGAGVSAIMGGTSMLAHGLLQKGANGAGSVQEAFAEILDGNKETASTGEAGDKTLVRRIREAIPQMQGQEAVAKIDGTEIPKQGTIVERLTQFISSIGNKVNRPGFGDVLFSRGKIKSSMLGHGAGNAKIETFAAVPAVIRNGTEIDYQPNWKGRNYDTYTFAAPIEYNGGKTYLGVIVQKDSASKRYYLHEVIDGNGNVLYKNGEAPALTPDGTSALSGDLDTVASAGTNPSDTTVPQEAAGVKGDGSVQEAFAEILDGNKETASTGEAVNVRAGRATVLKHPYAGETPTQFYADSRIAPVIPDEAITRASTRVDAAEKAAASGEGRFKNLLTRAYEAVFQPAKNVPVKGLAFRGKQYTVDINNGVPGKVISDVNHSAEKIALLEMLPEIVTNGEYVGSTNGKENSHIVRYDHFETPITIRGEPYLALFETEVYPNVNNYKTHRLVSVELVPQSAEVTGTPPASTESTPALSDTIVPQEAAGVKGENSTPDGQNAPEDGLGAANAGFTRNAGEQVPTQNKTVTQNPFMTDEEKARFSPGTHERVSEEESRSRAGNSFYADGDGNIVNLHETVDGLLSKELWTGTDQDTAQMAQQELIKEARETGDWDRVTALAAAIEAQGTETGRSLQARKKWAQTGTGIVTEAARALESAKKGTDRGSVLGTVSEMAERYDSAADAGDAQALADIIRETSKIRRTGSFFGNRLSRTMEKALGRAVEQNDVEFLKSLASGGIVRIAADYQGTKAADAVRTIRRNAMLSKVSTIMRNLVSNNVFDPLDSVSRNMSVPLDMLLSRYTGTRSVAADRSWFSKAKRQGSMDGMYRAMLEVGLDLDADAGKYETGSGRTFKMAGGLFSRLMSSWEKWMGYALNVTDEFQKGGIRSEVQRGVDELRGKGLVADDSLSDAGQTEALYRTFQDKTALSNALLGLRRGLNNLNAGGVGAGDIALPFAQVPANLASRSLEYSPIGLANGLRELGQVLRAAKNGTLTAAQQAKAVQDVGRGLNGTALIAGAAALALGGVLRVADAGGSDDRDRAALEKQSGLSGTQLNVDALLRWANGGDTKWRSGDTLVSIGFLDPLNAQLTTGALIAEDVKSGDADAGSVLGDSLAGTLQAVMDLPVMSVFSDVSNAYRYSGAETEGGRLADAALSYAAGQASSVIPNALKGIAQGTDGYQRDAYTSGSLAGEVLDNIKASIPGLRQTLPAKQDSYGGDMKNGGGLLNFLNTNILPGSVAKYTPSEVTQKLDEIYDATGNAAVYPDRKAPGTVTAGGEKYELSAEEKRQYQKTRGSVFEETVDAVLRNTGKTSPEELAEMLEEVRQYANEKAKRELLESRGAEYEPSGDAKKLDGADAQTAADYLMMKSAWEDAADRETADAEDYAVLGRMLDAYDNMPQSSKEAIAKISGVEKLLDAAEAGVDPESYFEARDKYTEIYNTDGLKAGEKATRLAEYLNAEFTREEAGKLQELFTYYSMIAGAPDYTAAIDSDYTDAEKLELIKLYDRSDGGDTYRKYAAAYDAGISLKTFDDFRNDTAGMKSEKDANGKDVRGKTKKDKIMAYIDGLELSDGQKDYLYYAAGYKESTIDDAPWH